MTNYFLIFTLLLTYAGGLTSCTLENASDEAEHKLSEVADKYVAIILGIGQHDSGYVDAYYGPKSWQNEAKEHNYSLDLLANQAVRLAGRLNHIKPEIKTTELILRHQYLTKQLASAQAYIRFLQGERLSFDDEAKALYDAEPPTYSEAHFQEILAELEILLPGNGTLQERVTNYKSDFIIPPAKLDTVFTTAILEAQSRTRNFVALPDSENFVVEYVNDKAWSAYNWYQGSGQSLIQVNTDLPIYIDRAIDLASHEGYPGHHVYNALLEKHLVQGRGWMEFSVYPLFSPQSLIAEGSANYGITVAFPAGERLAFEQAVLYPLAGLNPDSAEKYHQVQGLLGKLNYAGNEAARGYLNGDISKEEAIAWLIDYSLYEPSRAAQRLSFIEKYRSYVINYNYGKDLVRQYVERTAHSSSEEDHWNAFKQLLSSPRLPSGLTESN